LRAGACSGVAEITPICLICDKTSTTPQVSAIRHGEAYAVVGFTVARDKIVEMNILADPARLRRLDLTVLAPGPT